MRLKNILKNSIYSLISLFFIGLLGIFIRKIFIYYLPIELLGVEGVFSNIVSVLSVAELGISNVITYSLYKEIAKKNYNEVNILIGILKNIYQLIGYFIIVLSVVIYFLLPYIINSNNIQWSYIQIAYIIQIGIILSSYFLAYRRILFQSAQKEYICIKIDIICKVICNLLMILSIIFFRNYYIYISLALIANILANLIIAKKSKAVFPYLENVKINFNDLKKRKIFFDLKNIIIHKVSFIIYTSIDIIIIANFLGLKMAGILSNYILIDKAMYSIMYRALQGISPSIGNLVYSDSKEKCIEVYETLDYIYWIISSIIFAIYCFIFQDFIKLFFGKNYLLDDIYIYLMGINIFLGIQFENVCNFRNAYGDFEKDKIYMILAAFTKTLISLIGIKFIGINSIILGTIIGFLFILYGRFKIVFKYKLKINIAFCMKKHIYYAIILLLEMIVIQQIIEKVADNISYECIFLKLIVILIIVIGTQLLFFKNKKEYIQCKVYINRIKNRY